MEPKDRKRFAARCLLPAAELYGKAPSDAVADVWWDALRPYDIEAVESAFRRHLVSPDTGQFMPKPADIVRMLAGTSEDAALVAWAKLDRAVRNPGCYASVVFDDPLIHRVVRDLGGWIRLGTKIDDEWPFVGREFQNRYRGFRSRNEAPEYPPRLIGIYEAENTVKGYMYTDVVLLGDVERAKLVAANGEFQPMIATRRLADVTTLKLLAGGRDVK